VTDKGILKRLVTTCKHYQSYYLAKFAWLCGY